MAKAWFRIRLPGQRGFSTVEVILAATVFAFLTTALVGSFVYGRASTANSGDRDRATYLAEEGLEAVRNIRDAAYANIPGTDGTYYLGQSGNIWTIGSTPEAAIDGIYTRQVVVASAGVDRKNITVNVSWTNAGVTRQASAVTRLTNWSASIATPGPIMMVYSKGTTTPFYRTWNGSTWSAEGSATAVTGNINYVVVKSSRTRNEAILGVQTSTGGIYVQIWNGTSWGSATLVATGPTTTRSFDIAYEKNSDEGLVVAANATSPGDFVYRTVTNGTLNGPNSYTTMPILGVLNWLELRQNPLAASNEIAFLALDASSDVYGMVWTGSGWNTMGAATAWDATATTSVTKKGIDVEYEQTSGEALFMWGDATSTDQYYRTWNGTTLSAATLLDIAAAGGVSEWIQLAARPSSNEIMLGVQDAGGDLNTRKWSGSAWDAAAQHPEHDATVENIASRNFDIVWETHASNPGEAWIMWGDQATVTATQWSGTAWGTAAVLSGSDDTSFIRLRADPVSGAVFSGVYQCSCSAGGARNINERRLTGGGSTWSAATIIWGGSTEADPVEFKIDIATP